MKNILIFAVLFSCSAFAEKMTGTYNCTETGRNLQLLRQPVTNYELQMVLEAGPAQENRRALEGYFLQQLRVEQDQTAYSIGVRLRPQDEFDAQAYLYG